MQWLTLDEPAQTLLIVEKEEHGALTLGYLLVNQRQGVGTQRMKRECSINNDLAYPFPTSPLEFPNLAGDVQEIVTLYVG